MQGLFDRDAGVVERDIEAAEALHRPLDEVAHLGLVADIGTHIEGAPAARLDLLLELAAERLATAAEGHGCALSAQMQSPRPGQFPRWRR